jgi:hypothetical protein
MATVIWLMRRVEACRGRLGFQQVDDDIADKLVRKGDALPPKSRKLAAPDRAWPPGLRRKLGLPEPEIASGPEADPAEETEAPGPNDGNSNGNGKGKGKRGRPRKPNPDPLLSQDD